jgi:hypothetical protein
MPRADASRRRCAIYTRKSSEEGLEQEFNSLAAQREACEAYIHSQQHEGWVLARTRYDDGGFSGGNLKDGWKGDMNAGAIAFGQQQVGEYLDEIDRLSLGPSLIGFTGDEPFITREHMRPRRASQCMRRWTRPKMSDYAVLALTEERP